MTGQIPALARYAMAIGCLVAIAIAFWPTTLALNSEWYTANSHYSHGYLLLIMALYFVWQRREHIGASNLLERVCGIGALLLVVAAWHIGDLGLVLALQLLCLAAGAVCLLFASFGLRSLYAGLWPFAILIFALPIWQYLNSPLRELASDVVARMLQPFGVTHFLEGTLVQLPNGSFEIEDGCSGLGFLLTSFSMAMIVAAAYQFRLSQYLRFLALGILLGLITNWVRIFIIIYAGYVTDMQSSLIEDHLWLGWVLFAVIVMPALYFYLDRLEAEEPSATTAVEPETQQLNPGHAVFVCGLLALAAGNSLVDFDPNSTYVTYQEPRINTAILNQCEGGCSSWSPLFHGADRESKWIVDSNRLSAGDVELYMGSYVYEADQKELIYFANDVTAGLSFVKAYKGDTALDYAAYATGLLGGREYLTVAWYQIGQHRTNRRLDMKLRQIVAKLQGKHFASVFALGAYCANDCDLTRRALESLATDLSLVNRQDDPLQRVSKK